MLIYYLLDDAWLSLGECCVRDAEVAGSNPVASIIFIYDLKRLRYTA